MRFFWTFGSMPELSHLSRAERREVLASARSHWYLLAMYARSIFAGFVVSMIAGLLALQLPTAPRLLAMFLVAIAVAIAHFQFQIHHARALMRLQIMDLMQGRRLPVCLKCGYDQTKNVTDRCPECGAAVIVQHRSAP